MLRRAVIFALLAGAFAAPVGAQPKPLLPGVTYERGVQFTTHGPVALHILTMPRPGGLYALRPILSNEAILGKETVTAMQKRVSAQATVASINGDLFNFADGHPSGALMRNGILDHPPLGERSSIGIDSTGGLHVDRVRFFGTWRGTGQRRPLNGLNEMPENGQVVLFTPAWGPATPKLPGVAEAVVAPFAATIPNADLTGPVVQVTEGGGGTPIPAGGAVLVARGTTIAPKLLAEAPVGTTLTTRLILQPDWTGVTDALGGGPVLVRNGKPVFRSFEGFTTDQLTPRDPRSAVGQLADGRIILVAVDGRQPGYSAGVTNFELAQTMARLGAVTASGLDAGGSTTMAFDGQLLNRPSDRRERPVAEALTIFYYGVYAPPPTADVLSPNGDGIDESETLGYKIVRPSTVTASLVGPGQVTIPVEAAVLKQPGTYPFAWDGVDPAGAPVPEGRWHWAVTATDDTGVTSTIDRPFSLNLTLAGVAARPALLRVPPRGATLVAGFRLAHPARIALRIETAAGTIVRTVTSGQQQAGDGRISWNGLSGRGTAVYPGRYLARVLATNEFGTAQLTAPFTVRRVAGPKKKHK